jgi:hypothetical protein
LVNSPSLATILKIFYHFDTSLFCGEDVHSLFFVILKDENNHAIKMDRSCDPAGHPMGVASPAYTDSV